MNFAFPLPGDTVEVCTDWLWSICGRPYRGNHYQVTGVHDHEGLTFVTIFAPCSLPGCAADHGCYTTLSASDIRPYLAA